MNETHDTPWNQDARAMACELIGGLAVTKDGFPPPAHIARYAAQFADAMQAERVSRGLEATPKGSPT